MAAVRCESKFHLGHFSALHIGISVDIHVADALIVPDDCRLLWPFTANDGGPSQ
jgi:hypothetical protein